MNLIVPDAEPSWPGADEKTVNTKGIDDGDNCRITQLPDFFAL